MSGSGIRNGSTRVSGSGIDSANERDRGVVEVVVVVGVGGVGVGGVVVVRSCSGSCGGSGSGSGGDGMTRQGISGSGMVVGLEVGVVPVVRGTLSVGGVVVEGGRGRDGRVDIYAWLSASTCRHFITKWKRGMMVVFGREEGKGGGLLVGGSGDGSFGPTGVADSWRVS